MVKIIDRNYQSGCCERVERWLVDTDAEVKDLPKAPPGSSAISAESGRTFYADTSGSWANSGSSSGSGGGGSSKITITHDGEGNVVMSGASGVEVTHDEEGNVLVGGLTV